MVPQRPAREESDTDATRHALTSGMQASRDRTAGVVTLVVCVG
jgi:hypothetical protein